MFKVGDRVLDLITMTEGVVAYDWGNSVWPHTYSRLSVKLDNGKIVDAREIDLAVVALLKEGDSVVVKEPILIKGYSGRVGVIKDISDHPVYPYHVDFPEATEDEEKTNMWFASYELEKV